MKNQTKQNHTKQDKKQELYRFADTCVLLLRASAMLLYLMYTSIMTLQKKAPIISSMAKPNQNYHGFFALFDSPPHYG